MAYRKIDGFDWQAAATDVLAGGWSGADIDAYLPAGGRFGGGAVSLLNSTRHLAVAFPSNPAQLGVALSLRFTGGWPGNRQPLIRTIDNGTPQAQLMLEPGGFLSVYRHNSRLAQAVSPLSLNAWLHLEFNVVIGDAGTATVHINGQPWLAAAGDTQRTANAFATHMDVRGMGTPGVYLDDLIWYYDAAPHARDLRVSMLTPESDTADIGFAPSDAGAAGNFAMVDDPAATGHDGDLSHVAGEAGARDIYGLSAPAEATGEVFAVQVTPVARKDDAGDRSMRAVLRSGASTQLATAEALGTAYAPRGVLLAPLDPAGGAWTLAALGALEAGAEAV